MRSFIQVYVEVLIDSMKTMSRSFVWGVVVASTTWCFSLYLYWLLTKKSTELSPSKIQWSPNESQQYVALKHKNPLNSLNQLHDDSKQQRIQDQKESLYKKYKKEKKFRKISQRLRDDLKAVEVNNEPGNFNNKCTTVLLRQRRSVCKIPGVAEHQLKNHF